MMSKLIHCLSIAVVLGVAVASPQISEAGTMPARAGKSDFPVAEPGCWSLFGPSVTNACSSTKFWYMALPNASAGSFWLWITAQGAGPSSNVLCASTGAGRDGSLFYSSGWYALPQFGAARDIQLPISIPGGGTGMLDCQAQPGGRIHTVSW